MERTGSGERKHLANTEKIQGLIFGEETNKELGDKSMKLLIGTFLIF